MHLGLKEIFVIASSIFFVGCGSAPKGSSPAQEGAAFPVLGDVKMGSEHYQAGPKELAYHINFFGETVRFWTEVLDSNEALPDGKYNIYTRKDRWGRPEHNGAEGTFEFPVKGGEIMFRIWLAEDRSRILVRDVTSFGDNPTANRGAAVLKSALTKKDRYGNDPYFERQRAVPLAQPR